MAHNNGINANFICHVLHYSDLMDLQYVKLDVS